MAEKLAVDLPSLFVTKPPWKMYKITKESFEGATVFPYVEGAHLEFKGGFNVPRKTIYQTMCAFLNSGGGHIILGIDDATHKIVGISQNRKEIDKYLLSIDNLIRNRALQTTTGEGLSQNEITTEVIPWGEKWIILHTILPKPDTKYQFSNGEVLVRLNASNQVFRTKPALVSYSEIERITKDYQKELFQIVKETNKTVGEVEKKVTESEKKRDEAEVRCAELTMLLHRQIMRDKEIAEDYLDHRPSKGFFKSLLCGLW